MKLKLLLSLSFALLIVSAMGIAVAEHNDEFPTNGCEVSEVTDTVVVSATGDTLRFFIEGKENPDVKVTKDGCLDVTFENNSNLDHDWTVVDESVDASADFHEIVHMDTPAGNTTHHIWKLPNKDVTLDYFCEQPGHRTDGMHGTFVVGAGSEKKGLPGFEFYMAFGALTALLIAIPVLRKRK